MEERTTGVGSTARRERMAAKVGKVSRVASALPAGDLLPLDIVAERSCARNAPELLLDVTEPAPPPRKEEIDQVEDVEDIDHPSALHIAIRSEPEAADPS